MGSSRNSERCRKIEEKPENKWDAKQKTMMCLCKNICIYIYMYIHISSVSIYIYIVHECRVYTVYLERGVAPRSSAVVRFRVSGFGFRVQGFRAVVLKVQDFGLRISTEGPVCRIHF